MGQTTPIKRRNRTSSAQRASRPSLEMRVSQKVKEMEDSAWRLPPGPQRDALLRKARQMETASHISEWLSSPGLRAPE
jgi:hypothetical protein